MRTLTILLVAAFLTACGGGDPDPCELKPGQTQVIGCAICVNSDKSPCPPLMPPSCGAADCHS